MHLFCGLIPTLYSYKKCGVSLHRYWCQFIDFVSPIQTVDLVTKMRFLIASTSTNVGTKIKIIFECSVDWLSAYTLFENRWHPLIFLVVYVISIIYSSSSINSWITSAGVFTEIIKISSFQIYIHLYLYFSVACFSLHYFIFSIIHQ